MKIKKGMILEYTNDRTHHFYLIEKVTTRGRVTYKGSELKQNLKTSGSSIAEMSEFTHLIEKGYMIILNHLDDWKRRLQ